MLPLTVSFLCFTIIASGSATNINSTFTSPRDACTVTDYSQVDAAVANCTQITIDGITVPTGKTLGLNLKDGAKVTFEGNITFEVGAWTGYFIIVRGNNITVTGAKGHVLDGNGTFYWHPSFYKPTFMYVQVTGNSKLNNINMLNCPKECVIVEKSNGVTFSNWNIDNSGFPINSTNSTYGFGIADSQSVVIKDSAIQKQDECICITSGSNITISGIYCYDTHGLTLAVGISPNFDSLNTVENVLFSDSQVVNSSYGIHVKTLANNGNGSINGVTFKNITFSDIRDYAINIQQDVTLNGNSTGNPVGNIPIRNLNLEDVQGSVFVFTYEVYILCASGGCSDWSWSGVSINGSNRRNDCNFTPGGFSC